MLNRRPATRKSPPTVLPHSIQTNQSEESNAYPRQTTATTTTATATSPISPRFHTSVVSENNVPPMPTPSRPVRSRVVSMPVVPSEYTQRIGNMAPTNAEDRSYVVGSIRTGPSVMERAALFGGSVVSNHKPANRRPPQDTSTIVTNGTPSSPRTIPHRLAFSLHPMLQYLPVRKQEIICTMKGTVKKWLSRGATAVVNQVNGTATKRDNTTRRDPLASLLPRDHRESINLHDIDAILDMGDDTEAIDIAATSLVSTPSLRVSPSVSAMREIWMAFESEAKSKIYTPNRTVQRENDTDNINGSSVIQVPATWLPLSKPKSSDEQEKHSPTRIDTAGVSIPHDTTTGQITHQQTTRVNSSSPVFLDLTPTDVTSPKDATETVTVAESTILPPNDDDDDSLTSDGHSMESVAVTAKVPKKRPPPPPPRPSRLHIPVDTTKPSLKNSSNSKSSLRSPSIHPSPVNAMEKKEYRTLRRVEPIHVNTLQSSIVRHDVELVSNGNTCSSPTSIDSHDIPKPWMMNEDVQWNGRDAEGLRRNSASDIQTRSAAKTDNEHDNEVNDKQQQHAVQISDNMEHYPIIHNGYESDDTVLRPPLAHSRSIHRPMQAGIMGRKTSRLTRRNSLASTLSGSDHDTLNTRRSEQLTLAVASPSILPQSSSSIQTWDDLNDKSGPKSPSYDDIGRHKLTTPHQDEYSPATSNDSLGSQYELSPVKSPMLKSKKDLHDLQALQMLAMRPTAATPLTPAKGGSWMMMVNRDIFDRASDMERRPYVADLEIVDELFYRPMQKLLSRNDMEAVFGNLKAVRVATERLMHALRRRQWQGQFHVATIGDLFIERIPSLECYIAYCANHMEATTRLQQLLQTDPRLNHWLQRRQSDQLCRNLNLASFLLQPMQRVTRYALLLRQISSFTPAKHADHQDIRQAVDLAEDLLRRSNEAARDRADLSRLKEIATSLIMDSQEQQLDLTGSTRHMGQRRFVMEGVWIKGRQGRRITAFLFTDLLLLCEPARAQAGMYKPYLAPIPLSELEVRETSGTRSLLRLEDSTFQIVHKKRSLTVKAENASTKRKWIQTIKECIGRCHEAERNNENGWLQAPSLRELSKKVLWAIRVMIVEVTGLTQQLVLDTATPRFERSTSSIYCSVSLNQRQTYRTAVVSTSPTMSISGGSHARWEQAFLFTITDLDDPLRVALYTYDRFSRDTCLGYCEVDLRFLEFLDVRGDERVALKLKKERHHKLQPAVPALPSAEPLSMESATATTPNVMSMFASSSERETGNSTMEQHANTSSAPMQSSINNDRTAPIVIVALSYRKSS
ncbi:hypothetical protein BDF22DRAFT_773196 [Syncephalis plumigaleata]|nr:hypothetical protein BDF22DRAFT_773196 [Syncephalis plumigaleata]